VLLDAPVVVATGDGTVPHVELPDQTRQRRPDRNAVVEVLHGDLDRPIQGLVVESRGPIDDLADQPDVMLHDALEEVHACDLSASGDAQAPKRVVVDAARRLDLQSRPRRAPPVRRRHAVGAYEGAGERLVRAVAGGDRDVEHAVVAGDQLVGGPFEPDPAAEPGGSLTRRGRHDAVEVEPRHVSPARDVLAVETGVVEAVGDDVDEAAEGVDSRTHTTMLPRRSATGLIGFA
jgi:hypothetical protein